MDQREIRKRLLKLLAEKGIKQRFICTKTNLANPVLSEYKLGIRELQPEQLQKLDEFLTSENY